MSRNIGPGLKELLAGAHEKYKSGLRIETEYLGSLPADPESYHYKCTVTGIRIAKLGGEEKPAEEKFTGHGDASPNETGAKRGTPAYDTPSRMAESRAIVRALRWATNVGETAAEEMPYSDRGNESSDVIEEEVDPTKPSGKQVSFLKSLVQDKLGGDWKAFAEEFGSPKELDKRGINQAITSLKER